MSDDYHGARLTIDPRRAATWRSLWRHHFRQRIASTATVLDLGAGYGDFINAVRAERRIAVDRWPGLKDHVAPDVEAVITPVTDLSVVYQDIRNYGTIFDIEDAAGAMVSRMQDTVRQVQSKIGDAPRPKVFSYSWEDGGGKPYAVGNHNVANAIITQAGGKNVFDDVAAVYGDVGWEDVVARNPDLIVIEVFGKPTQAQFDEVVDKAKTYFTTDPALQNVTAVKNRNFYPVLAETYYIGGVRNADAVASLAKALHPAAFK